VASYPIDCPANPEDITESYSEGSLPADQIATFEEHLLICSECRDRLEAADRYMPGYGHDRRSAACIEPSSGFSLWPPTAGTWRLSRDFT